MDARQNIKIMIDITNNKKLLIDQLYELTQIQKQLIEEKVLDEQKFDEIVKRKQVLLNKIYQEDDNYENAFLEIKDILEKNNKDYYDDIKKLKQLINLVINSSNDLRALELNNKQKIAFHFSHKKNSIKKIKRSKIASRNYHKIMNKSDLNQSFFFDKKK